MSAKTVKKATFKDLIARKLQKEADQFKAKDIYVSSMDVALTFVKPKDDLILDTLDGIGDKKETRNIVAAYKKLIYHCCNMLQDVELHKELEVKDPYDVVDQIFNLADILEIGEQLMGFIDIGSKVDEIKNS